jgi:6-phosphogluconolactonase
LNSKKVFIGTNTGSGVYQAEYLDGSLDNLKPFYKIKNPSYLATTEGTDKLFSLSERGDGADIYSLNTVKDTVTPENSAINVPGRGLCHISISPDGKFIFGACYESGHVYSVLNQNGSLVKVISTIDQNQYQNIKCSKARAHCIKATLDGKYVLAVDLGLDALIVYSLTENGELCYRSHYKFKDGTGPRHICFGKNDSEFTVVYLISEYSNELYTFKFMKKEGVLECINNISSLPSDFKGKSHGAAVKISPDGKKVAVSNRVEGTDGIISIFNTDNENKPYDMKTIYTSGCFPRDFEYTPDSDYIIAANQNSDSISVISLTNNKSEAEIYPVPQPVCIIFK